MDLAKKIGQLFFIGLEGNQLDLQSRYLLRTISPGGVILFNRNIESPHDLFDLCQQIRAELPIVPFIGIDAEGGIVNRLRTIAPQFPPAMALGATDNEIFSFRQGQLTGKLLFLLGINLNFAPVVDLALKSSVNSIGSRSFGSFPSLVIKMARGYLRGLSQQGIMGALKHFPGIGSSPSDPHKELPKITRSKKKLLENDIKVFNALKESSHIIMTGHLHYSGFDRKYTLPASLSSRIIGELLREQMGFKKIVITDDLEMGAITQELEINEASMKSLQVGTDMLLICHSYEKMLSAYNYLLNAVEKGEISDVRINSSVNRIMNIKNNLADPAQHFSFAEFSHVCQQIEEFSYILAENAVTQISKKKIDKIPPDADVSIFYPKKNKNSTDLGSILREEYSPFLNNLYLSQYDPDNPALTIESKKKEIAIIVSYDIALYPESLNFFKQIANHFQKLYYVSIDFPNEIKAINADATIALYTDMPRFLRTALLTLLGKLTARGKLPIEKKLLILADK